MSHQSTDPDVVYVVGPQDRNEELRYSLRTLVNVPHRNVVVAGYRPPWLQNVVYLPVPSLENKYRSAEANLLAACQSELVSDPFYLMNDDFFIMQPHPDGIPIQHLGHLQDVLRDYRNLNREGRYTRGMEATAAMLQKLLPRRVLRSYELHAPMLVEKLKMEQVLSMRDGIDNYHLRTVYGNLFLRGSKTEDVKVYVHADGYTADHEHKPLLSTSDSSWTQKVGAYIREQYPDPSPYEAPTSHTYARSHIIHPQ